MFHLNAFVINRHVFQCHSWNRYGQGLVPLNINNTQTDTERERVSLIINFIRVRRELREKGTGQESERKPFSLNFRTNERDTSLKEDPF